MPQAEEPDRGPQQTEVQVHTLEHEQVREPELGWEQERELDHNLLLEMEQALEPELELSIIYYLQLETLHNNKCVHIQNKIIIIIKKCNFSKFFIGNSY